MLLQSQEFSSQGQGGCQGFAGYHDLYAPGSDVGRGAGQFHARVDAYRFERMLLFERHLSGVVHSRSQARVRRDGFEHVVVQMLLGGSLLAGRLGEERLLCPGEIIVFDTTLPQRSQATQAHFITVSLARDQIERLVPDTRRLHGTVIPADAAGLLGDFLGSLARRAKGLPSHAAHGVSGVVAGLLAAAAGASIHLRSETYRGAVHALREERVMAYVEQHLADPGLTADRAAHHLGISRSSLDRALQTVGGFGRHVLHRRLERLRASLCRPGEMRPVGALSQAHGFTSESHCNRAFRAAYALPPGEYRAELHRLRHRNEPDKETATMSFVHWHPELN